MGTRAHAHDLGHRSLTARLGVLAPWRFPSQGVDVLPIRHRTGRKIVLLRPPPWRGYCMNNRRAARSWLVRAPKAQQWQNPAEGADHMRAKNQHSSFSRRDAFKLAAGGGLAATGAFV